MTKLLQKHYTTIQHIPAFYLDRLARLLPQFWFWSLLTLILLLETHMGFAHLPWMNFLTCTPLKVAANFTLFANNFYQQFAGCVLIPTSWSLGLEAFFYSVFPFVLLFQSRVLMGFLATLSLSVMTAACFGLWNFDLYAYRFLVGTLHLFLAGAAIANPALFGRKLPTTVAIVAAILFGTALFNSDMFQISLLKEVLVGTVVAVPVVSWAVSNGAGRFDQILGSLSYGVFLTHVLVRWIGEAFFGIVIWNFANIAAAITISVSAAAVSFLAVERPFLLWRRSLRQSADSVQ